VARSKVSALAGPLRAEGPPMARPASVEGPTARPMEERRMMCLMEEEGVAAAVISASRRSERSLDSAAGTMMEYWA